MKHIDQIQKSIKSCDKRFLEGCIGYVDGLTHILDTPKDMDTTYQEKYDYYFASATEEYTDMDFILYKRRRICVTLPEASPVI